jgi:O-antigen ligase
LALNLFLVYLFAMFSRLLEFVLTGYHITALLFLAAVPAAFLCGAWQKTSLRGPIKWLIAFAVWFAIAVPFSVWKGGSAGQFRGLATTLISFVPLLGLPSRFRDVRKIYFVLGVSGVVFGIGSAIFGRLEGRFTVTREGTFSNTNDLAQFLMLVLPFVIFPLDELRFKWPWAILVGLGLIPMVPTLLRTGSRSMLVVACCMFVVALWRAPAVMKFVMLIGALGLLVSSVILLPSTVRDRYLTFFNPSNEAVLSQDDYEYQLSAVESTRARRQLLKDSIDYTLKKPLFGVGPGMFSVARGQDRLARNELGQWHVGHNAYLQVSSECGIPAAIFYILALGTALVYAHRADRYHKGLNNPVSRSIRAAGFTLFVSILGVIVFGMFLSNAYAPQMLTLIALSALLERISREERERIQAANTAPPGPPPLQKFSYSVLPR